MPRAKSTGRKLRRDIYLYLMKIKRKEEREQLKKDKKIIKSTSNIRRRRK